MFIPGAGFIFSLLNNTNILLVEGTFEVVCIELIHPTNLESLDQTPSLNVTSAETTHTEEGTGNESLDVCVCHNN